MKYWSTLKTDDDAIFDKEINFDGNEINPMITFGTNPGMGISITNGIPKADTIEGGEITYQKSLKYMGYSVRSTRYRYTQWIGVRQDEKGKHHSSY